MERALHLTSNISFDTGKHRIVVAAARQRQPTRASVAQRCTSHPVQASAVSPATPPPPDRRDSPPDSTGRVGFGQGAVRVHGRASRRLWPRPRQVPASGRCARLVVLFGSGGWAVARSGASSACGGLTSRSSRSRFVTQITWQVKLAMCFASLRVSA